jgi:hypothetical protein
MASAPTGEKKSFLRIFRKPLSKRDAKAKEKAAKAAKAHTPTHSLSMFVGTVSRLSGVDKGAKLRLTLKVLGSKSKLDFTYVPGGSSRCFLPSSRALFPFILSPSSFLQSLFGRQRSKCTFRIQSVKWPTSP